MSSTDDEKKLLDSMKRLAVCAQNNLVNIVTFPGMAWARIMRSQADLSQPGLKVRLPSVTSQ